jgi:hypothetical protein
MEGISPLKAVPNYSAFRKRKHQIDAAMIFTRSDFVFMHGSHAAHLVFGCPSGENPTQVVVFVSTILRDDVSTSVSLCTAAPESNCVVHDDLFSTSRVLLV